MAETAELCGATRQKEWRDGTASQDFLFYLSSL